MEGRDEELTCFSLENLYAMPIVEPNFPKTIGWAEAKCELETLFIIVENYRGDSGQLRFRFPQSIQNFRTIIK